MAKALKLTDVLREVHEKSGPDSVSVREVVHALEFRGYGPLLLIAGLITVLPTGAIPGVPTLTALLIVFISVQLLFGKDHPWVPKVLAERSISKQKFESARRRGEHVTAKVDRIIKPRFQSLFNPVSVRLIALVCCIIAVTMPPLELVPFLAFVPALAVTILGLALSARDGLLALVGLAVAALGLYAALRVLI